MLGHVVRKATNSLACAGLCLIPYDPKRKAMLGLVTLFNFCYLSGKPKLNGAYKLTLDTILFNFTVFGAPSWESESVMPTLCSGSTVFIGKSLFRPGWPRGCCTLLRCAPTHRFVQLLHCVLVDIAKYTCPNPSSPTPSPYPPLPHHSHLQHHPIDCDLRPGLVFLARSGIIASASILYLLVSCLDDTATPTTML